MLTDGCDTWTLVSLQTQSWAQALSKSDMRNIGGGFLPTAGDFLPLRVPDKLTEAPVVILMHPTSLVFCFFLFVSFLLPASCPPAVFWQLLPFLVDSIHIAGHCWAALFWLTFYISKWLPAHIWTLNVLVKCSAGEERKEKKQQSALSLPLVSFQEGSRAFDEHRRML